MTISGNNPLAYQGVSARNPATVIVAARAPTANDLGYAIGTNWVDQPNDDVYELTSVVNAAANWTILGSSSSAILDVAHGGTGVATMLNHGVLVGAGTSPITSLSVGATGTVLAGSTGADPAFTASPSVTGSVTAGTTLTATLGNITATNGNFVKGTAGNKDVYTSVASTTTAGANSAGTVTLVSGTATISTTAVTANSLIRVYRQSVGATGAAATGNLSIGTITPATSFVINSVTVASATSIATTDVSVVFWEIVN